MTSSSATGPVEPQSEPAPGAAGDPVEAPIGVADAVPDPETDPARGARFDLFAALVLVALVAAVYGRSLRFGFVYDDAIYVAQNPDVFSDWSVQSVRWALTTNHFSNWHPLTWLSYRFDASLWGRRPAGFHATNVLLHAVSVVLAYHVLRRATGNRGPSLFAAALWAVHPLHVESVAWISSRKDVLGMLCVWLSLGAYGAWARTGRRGWYAASLAAFAAGMTAKQTIALFPFVLLLWDAWPLRRVLRSGAPPTGAGPSPGAPDANGSAETNAGPAPSSVPESRAAPDAASSIPSNASSAPAAAPLLNSFFDAAPTPRAALEERREFERTQVERTQSGQDESFPREAASAASSIRGTPGTQHAIVRRRPAALILEKLPFVAVALVAVGLALRAQQAAGSVRSLEEFPLAVRAANAVVSYALHLRRTVWPSDLAVAYPHPRGSVLGAPVVLGGLLLAAVTAGVVLAARRRPYLAVGWLWFLGALLPACGLIQVGNAGTADRYAHFPLVGIEVALAWLGADLLRSRSGPKAVPYVVGSLVVALAAGAAFRQVGFWADNETLFRRALAVAPDNAAALIEVGNRELETGAFDSAVARYERALEIDPQAALAASNLGFALFRGGRTAEAERQMRRALEIRPNLALAHANLGALLESRGDVDGALVHLRRAVESDPNFWTAHYNLGKLLADRGETAAAVRHYERALAIQPVNARARNNLATLVHGTGDRREAVRLLRQAVEDDPGLAEAHLNLGLLLQQEKPTQAEGTWNLEEAARLDPEIAERLFRAKVLPRPGPGAK